jgi:hypothetical protein
MATISYKKYFYVMLYKKDMIFLSYKVWYAINMLLKLYIMFLTFLTTSNEKKSKLKISRSSCEVVWKWFSKVSTVEATGVDGSVK